MFSNNPALEALKGIPNEDGDSIAGEDLVAIVNGIRTCGPIFAAALAGDGLEIDKDIDEMLAASKGLIADVNQELISKEVVISPAEHAAICAFCIRVIAKNWETAQEVFSEWVNPITRALLKTGISAEHRSTDFNTLAGSGLMANIIASGEIFSALNSDPRIPFDDMVYMDSVKELHQASARAVDKLAQFHIPYEDADPIQHHIKLQASSIFVSVIRCEFRAYHASLRKSSLSDSSEDALLFSFDEVFRKYRTAIDSFVTSIYVNSRVVS